MRLEVVFAVNLRGDTNCKTGKIIETQFHNNFQWIKLSHHTSPLLIFYGHYFLTFCKLLPP